MNLRDDFFKTTVSREVELYEAMKTRLLRRILLRFCALPLAVLGSQLCSAASAKQESFEGPGPFVVSMSSVDNQGLLFAPQGAAPEGSWPAVVFAHGLCGPAEKYSSTLSRLASWGFVVLANQQQGDCGVMNFDHPFATLGNLFQLPVKFNNAVDFSAMADDIRSNLRYLQSRSDVDSNRLALMGHSMGGGMVIDVASGLGTDGSDQVKAVVAIAPWNGVQPTPSSVVGSVSVPILIFCSMSDALCPCSGEVKLSDTQGILTGSVSPEIPFLFGASADPTWHGGAMAIFDNAKNAVLMDIDRVSHFTIAGIDDGRDMQNFADWARGESGLNFNKPSRPYVDLPVMEYAIAFLNQSLNLDVKSGQSFLEGSSSDSRIVDVRSSR